MNTDSAGKGPWIVSPVDPAATLEITTPKETVILSWNQFVYAEGGDIEVRIAFASHDVVVKGIGLDPLLHAIAAKRVASIRVSSRAECFPSLAGRFISEIVVRRVEEA